MAINRFLTGVALFAHRFLTGAALIEGKRSRDGDAPRSPIILTLTHPRAKP